MENSLELINIEEMKNIDVRLVDPDTLVDIRDVKINMKLPQQERLLDFIKQIKNPYCYKYGKTIIKVSFMETEATIEDQLELFGLVMIT